MIVPAEQLSLAVLIIRAVVVATMAVRLISRRLGAPPLIGFILLGFGLRLIDARWGFLSGSMMETLELLGAIGIFALLFRVGLESDVKGLLGELPRALAIWVGNVGLSGLLGYVAARYVLELALIPSLFIAVALTATSVGVSVQMWHDAGRLKTRRGNLLLDVAELDDVSAVVLMMMLFALAPVLAHPGSGSLLSVAGAAAALIGLKTALFAAACFLFARYAERPITDLLSRVGPVPQPLLPVVGMGLIITAFAGLAARRLGGSGAARCQHGAPGRNRARPGSGRPPAGALGGVRRGVFRNCANCPGNLVVHTAGLAMDAGPHPALGRGLGSGSP